MFPTFRSWLTVSAERLSGRPRRLLALACFGLAGFSALHGGPTQRPDVAVAVVTRDLAAGASLTSQDVTLARWPDNNRPASALGEVAPLVGRRIAAPMSRGEPLTTARLLDTSITRSLRTGQVAVTVHVESTGAAGLIQPGSRIDLYARPSPTVLVDGAAAEPSAEASLVATSVVVLAAYPDDDRTSSDTSTVVLAATRAVASQVANRPSGAFLATLLPPS